MPAPGRGPGAKWSKRPVARPRNKEPAANSPSTASVPVRDNLAYPRDSADIKSLLPGASKTTADQGPLLVEESRVKHCPAEPHNLSLNRPPTPPLEVEISKELEEQRKAAVAEEGGAKVAEKPHVTPATESILENQLLGTEENPNKAFATQNVEDAQHVGKKSPPLKPSPPEQIQDILELSAKNQMSPDGSVRSDAAENPLFLDATIKPESPVPELQRTTEQTSVEEKICEARPQEQVASIYIDSPDVAVNAPVEEQVSPEQAPEIFSNENLEHAESTEKSMSDENTMTMQETNGELDTINERVAVEEISLEKLHDARPEEKGTSSMIENNAIDATMEEIATLEEPAVKSEVQAPLETLNDWDETESKEQALTQDTAVEQLAENGGESQLEGELASINPEKQKPGQQGSSSTLHTVDNADRTIPETVATNEEKINDESITEQLAPRLVADIVLPEAPTFDQIVLENLIEEVKTPSEVSNDNHNSIPRSQDHLPSEQVRNEAEFEEQQAIEATADQTLQVVYPGVTAGIDDRTPVEEQPVSESVEDINDEVLDRSLCVSEQVPVSSVVPADSTTFERAREDESSEAPAPQIESNSASDGILQSKEVALPQIALDPMEEAVSQRLQVLLTNNSLGSCPAAPEIDTSGTSDEGTIHNNDMHYSTPPVTAFASESVTESPQLACLGGPVATSELLADSPASMGGTLSFHQTGIAILYIIMFYTVLLCLLEL